MVSARVHYSIAMPSPPVESGLEEGGTARSFEELFREVAPAVYAWAFLRVGAPLRARIDASDIVQEASLRALRGFDKFDPSVASFRRWFFRIAKNVVSEALRGATRAGILSPNSDWSLGQLPASLTRISARAARDESLAKVLGDVETMEPGDKEVFMRCGLIGESFVVAAKRAGVTPDSMRMRWNRLREKLRVHPHVTELFAAME